jgi:TPR repeat protein
MPNSRSVPCTTTPRASRRTTRRPHTGIAKQLTRGHDLSQFYLGTSYARGLGVPQNYALAYMWLNLAAIKSSNDDPAARNLRQDKL